VAISVPSERRTRAGDWRWNVERNSRWIPKGNFSASARRPKRLICSLVSLNLHEALNFHRLLRPFLRGAFDISILRDEEECSRRKCAHFYLYFENFRVAEAVLQIKSGKEISVYFWRIFKMSEVSFEHTRSENETLCFTFTGCPTFRLYLCRVFLTISNLKKSNSLRCLFSRFQISNNYMVLFKNARSTKGHLVVLSNTSRRL